MLRFQGRFIAALLLLASVVSSCKQSPQEVFRAGMDAYQKEDYATALKTWRPLAEQGEADAQTNVGVMYSQGRGVAQDYAEAVKWYRMAAMQHHADAQYNLAIAYRDGKGVEASAEEAAHWFRFAAEKGHLRAQLKLGEIYDQGIGVEPDGREAAKWYEMAANKGEPAAQLALGEIYQRGRGMPPDRIQAYVWYSAAMASEDNLVRARAMLARTRLFNDMDEGEMFEAERQAEEFREVQRTLANQGR